MTRFLHLTPLGRKTAFLTPLTSKTERFDPPPDFCIKISRHLQKMTEMEVYPQYLVIFYAFQVFYRHFYKNRIFYECIIKCD